MGKGRRKPRKHIWLSRDSSWLVLLSAMGIVVAIIGGIFGILGVLGVFPVHSQTSSVSRATQTPSSQELASPTRPTSSASESLPPSNATLYYQAMVPGWRCDAGAEHWVDWAASTSMCSINAMQLSTTSSDAHYAQEAFYGPAGTAFPANYRVSVEISRLSAGTCAGIQYQLTTNAANDHYGAAVCIDGSWTVGLYDSVGNVIHQMARGNVSQANAYMLTITFNRGMQTVAINKDQITSFNGAQAQSGTFIALGAFSSQGIPQAAFSGFVMDTLP